MNAIQVKSYLFPDNIKISINSISQADEIRRFNLAINNWNGVYKSLIEKIRSAYGSLLPNLEEIKTYWQDDENELVGFSSDAEMQYAFDLQTAIKMSKPYENGTSSSLFKVYIARKKVDSQSQPTKQPCGEESLPGLQIHIGVVCDGCNGAIIGKRFKCSVCPDYDLCETCLNKDIHKDQNHSFITIDKPKRSCPFMNGGGGHHRRRGFGHCQRQRHHPFHDNASQSNNNTASASNPLQQSLNDFLPFIANSLPIVRDPEQLKSVGEYLKNFLDPFGIDVDYYVDNITGKHKQETSGEKNEKPQSKEQEANDQAKQQTPGASSNVTNEEKSKSRSESLMDEDIAFETSPKENAPSPKVSATPVQEIAPSSPLAPTAPPARDELIDLRTSQSPFDFASNALKNMLEKKSSEEPAATPKITSSTESNKRNDDFTEENGFNLVDIEKELKIIRSIEQLKQMGYSDDGGWLTRLVTAKEGNINAVLDAISPSGSKN